MGSRIEYPYEVLESILAGLAKPRDLPLAFLEHITENFSEERKIGEGGFGTVYKGAFRNQNVAVKKIFLNNYTVDERLFRREVESLMMIDNHRNIVRFLGFCSNKARVVKELTGSEQTIYPQTIELLLCFEYISNGSLDKHITDEFLGLTWDTRFDIIRGICEGLRYLHEDKSIIHMDLKPASILLDDQMVPKINDFGQSRFAENTHTMGVHLSTRGYCAPEYENDGRTSNKADMYSLGVVIIELVTGSKEIPDMNHLLGRWTRRWIESATQHQPQQVFKCMKIAARCMLPESKDRPSISDIINDLSERLSTRGSIGQSGSKACLTFQYLEYITNNFCDERILGKGGFGVVYKGVLHNGDMVAVKKIFQAITSSQTQFENEVNVLMKLKHQNIVRLIGYCYETRHLHMPYEGKSVFAGNSESLLCLEYMPNGSLEKYISDASSRLNWHTRWKVIEGISYGLQYLHEYSDEPIIHLDLKPANILLDAYMLPKITDFGLSRLLDQTKTIHTAITGGTLGYMPPEFLRGIITPMWDIFSLGVIIMEVITGHRDYPHDIRKSSKAFIELELQKWRNRLQKEPGYTSLETDCQQIKRCIQIGLICVNPERTKRPTMKKVIGMLEGFESMDWYISNEKNLQSILCCD